MYVCSDILSGLYLLLGQEAIYVLGLQYQQKMFRVIGA
jgi:hypothetical protein